MRSVQLGARAKKYFHDRESHKISTPHPQVFNSRTVCPPPSERNLAALKSIG
jgi:hypothetical protein